MLLLDGLPEHGVAGRSRRYLIKLMLFEVNREGLPRRVGADRGAPMKVLYQKRRGNGASIEETGRDHKNGILTAIPGWLPRPDARWARSLEIFHIDMRFVEELVLLVNSGIREIYEKHEHVQHGDKDR